MKAMRAVCMLVVLIGVICPRSVAFLPQSWKEPTSLNIKVQLIPCRQLIHCQSSVSSSWLPKEEHS